MLVFMKSIVVGIFAIFPGISGSALAISLNIYDRLFLSLGNIKDNKKFIIMVLMGISLGVMIGSNIIIYLSNYQNILYYVFIGLILGDIPFIIKETNRKGRVRYIPLIISFFISMITFISFKNIFSSNVSFIKMIFGGILFSFGKIFPGVSSSFFLIILGIYNDILVLFSNPIMIIINFLYYFPFLIGVIIGLIIFIKLLNYLIINKYDFLYSVLIGFMISSIITILPKFELSFTNIIGVILMILSFIISFKFKVKKDI